MEMERENLLQKHSSWARIYKAGEFYSTLEGTSLTAHVWSLPSPPRFGNLDTGDPDVITELAS